MDRFPHYTESIDRVVTASRDYQPQPVPHGPAPAPKMKVPRAKRTAKPKAARNLFPTTSTTSVQPPATSVPLPSTSLHAATGAGVSYYGSSPPSSTQYGPYSSLNGSASAWSYPAPAPSTASSGIWNPAIPSPSPAAHQAYPAPPSHYSGPYTAGTVQSGSTGIWNHGTASSAPFFTYGLAGSAPYTAGSTQPQTSSAYSALGIYPPGWNTPGPAALTPAPPTTTVATKKRGKAVPKKIVPASLGTGQGHGLSPALPYRIQAQPAVPPNWEDSLNKAIQVLFPFLKVPVPETSEEYRVLAGMMVPHVTITKIERVVNTGLWKRFLGMRKELMCSKVEDWQVLTDLGLDDKELHHRAHVNMNFSRDPALGGQEYSDNVALLYHCTRAKVDDVLSQGLDERLGNSTGLLGRGIYFADDPKKSMSYDSNSTLLLFAVLLGDCLSVKGNSSLVREPEKSPQQRRNHTDLFFDSIAGRPTGGANEYVIYNRGQCVPLYAVSYSSGGRGVSGSGDPFSGPRASLPPFVWAPGRSSNFAVPGPAESVWPFFAQTIFGHMQGDQVQPEPADGASSGPNQDPGEQEPGLAGPSSSGTSVHKAPASATQESVALKLSTLTELGFTDDVRNLQLLARFGHNLERTINHILENPEEPGPPNAGGPSTSAIIDLTGASPTNAEDQEEPVTKRLKSGQGDPKDLPEDLADWDWQDSLPLLSGGELKSYGEDPNPNAAVAPATNGQAPPPPPPLDKDCPICCVEYPPAPQHWRVLKCSHELCAQCHARLETEGTTMSGLKQTYLKCPFCQACSGLEIGSCPDGFMKVIVDKRSSAAGHEGSSTLVLHYSVTGKYGLNRTAYLPNTAEGKRISELLRTAWDRRLCFSIGTSMTTGAADVLVWNIHHKTALQGGVQAHGYPDPTYLTRVQQELSQYGIE